MKHLYYRSHTFKLTGPHHIEGPEEVDAAAAAAEVKVDTSDASIQAEAGKIGPAADKVGGIPASALIQAGADAAATRAIETELVPPVEEKADGIEVAQVEDPGVMTDALTDEAAEQQAVLSTLSDRGIDLETFEDRTIGGESEAKMLADFLADNPELDAEDLVETTGNLFSQMSEEEMAEAMAKMTPEEYDKFLQTAKERLESPVDTSTNTYVNEEGETVTEDNAFDIREILSNAGFDGNQSPTYGASGTAYPGTFDVPSISNQELMVLVEDLAGDLGANVAALKAVVAVESGGDLSATRYEAHHGHKGRDEATSFGAFQIMGFNAKSLGYSSATAMKEAFESGGAEEQVRAFGKFLETRNLVRYITAGQTPNFEAFAHTYNGAGYAKLNYHGKMAAAYRQYATS